MFIEPNKKYFTTTFVIIFKEYFIIGYPFNHPVYSFQQNKNILVKLHIYIF